MSKQSQQNKIIVKTAEYQREGGKIRKLADGPGRQQCSECEHWRAGRGDEGCIRCPHYRLYTIASAPRSQIPIDILPQALLEEIADAGDEMPRVLAALRLLPDDLALIVAARHLAGLPATSVAAILHTSTSNLYRREQLAITTLRQYLLAG